MSDDHTAQAVGVYATLLKDLDPTPTIDSLAREGIVFDNAFCTNSICTPSRASIITGQYAHTNGVFDLGGNIAPENQALPILMSEAGYQTAMIGKWHLKQEPNFDYYKVLPGQGKYFDTEFRIQGDQPWPKNTVTHNGRHSSDAITDSTLDWFRNERDPGKPFFVCHQYKAPHDYFENAPRYQSYLADVDIPEPDTLYDPPNTFGSLATRGYDNELLPHIGTSIGSRNPRRSYATHLFDRFPEEFPPNYDPAALSEEETTRLAYQGYLKKYLRCVKGVDDNLKRLFDYLKEEGLYDNTVIIYTGDQGFWLGEKDYQDKRWAYDESARMPFIVRYPEKIPAGIRSDALIENVDYPALMLDYAGIDIPSDFQGRSFPGIRNGPRAQGLEAGRLLPLLDAHGPSRQSRGNVDSHENAQADLFLDERRAVIKRRRWELYDLVKDPQELRNVYYVPKYNHIREELKTQFAQLRMDVGDDGSHYPKCEAVVQEFWDYSEEDRLKAIEISANFKRIREAELANVNR